MALSTAHPPHLANAHVQVVQSKFVLFMNTSEDVMRQRMVQRGRGDDNDETIWKRFGEAYNAPLCWQAMCTVRADIPPPSDLP